MEISDNDLIDLARQARSQAYVPYSHFPVGAAVEVENGQVFTGCNIENGSFGATNCAERTAIFTAVAAGFRQIKRLAVVCNDSQPCMPCGICRQVISEFADDDFYCLCAAGSPSPDCADPIRKLDLDELLPNRFYLDHNRE